MNMRRPVCIETAAQLADIGVTGGVRSACLVGLTDPRLAAELRSRGVETVQLQDWSVPPGHGVYDLVVADIAEDALEGGSVRHAVDRLHRLARPEGRIALVCGELAFRRHWRQVGHRLRKLYANVWSRAERVSDGRTLVFMGASGSAP